MSPLRAQLNVSAQISGVSIGGGLYDYSITLTNKGDSTSPVGTFWYAWIPGQNYLPSDPASVSSPTGWTDTISGSGGYGIHWTTSSAALAQGSSLLFSFESTDTPTTLAGNAVSFPTTPIGTSFVYGGAAF